MYALAFSALVAACLCLQGCGLPESSFELARESRLPRWFTLPPGLSRSDVSVRLAYYSSPWGGTATFKLLDVKRKKTMAEANGTEKGLEPIIFENPRAGFPPGYPSYE